MSTRKIPSPGLKPLIRYLSIERSRELDEIFLQHMKQTFSECFLPTSVSEDFCNAIWGLFFQENPCFKKAFKIGCTFDFRDFGALGLLFSISRNYRDVMNANFLFSQLYQISDPYTQIKTETEFIQQLLIGDSIPMVRRFAAVYAATLIHRSVSQLVDSSRFLKEIRLPIPDLTPQEKNELTQLFGATITISDAYVEIVYDVALIDLPLRDADESLRVVLTQHLQGRSLGPMQNSGSDFTLQIKARIRELKNLPALTAETLALDFNMSRRTFDRRIAMLGLTFNSIKDEVYREMALEMMQQGVNAKVIADELGFSNISSFSRAFKRWTKSSPRQLKSIIFDRKEPIRREM